MDIIPDTVEYRDIDGFPGYRVGNDGSVWSCWALVPQRVRRGMMSIQTNTWKQLKAYFGRYALVTLYRDHRKSVVMVHLLVLRAFYGPCPPGMQALHLNDVGLDNRADNLRWGTSKENSADRQRNGYWHPASGANHWNARLDDVAVAEIRRLYATGVAQKDLAAQFQTSRATVHRIVHNLTRK